MPKPKPKQPIDDTNAEFSRLFWAAREEQYLKKGVVTDGDATSVAIAFAEAQGWDWAKLLIEASRLQGTKAYDQSQVLLDKGRSAVPVFWEVLVHHLQGVIFDGQKRYDEAIDAYKKAIATPNFDQIGNTWNNLGNTYSNKGDFDLAIEAYNKAIETPNSEATGDAWNNLGVAYNSNGYHDLAIEAYQKAIETPNYDRTGQSWNNLGVAYKSNGDHDLAIEAYQKAIATPNYYGRARAFMNLGQAYIDIGNPTDAMQAYVEALKAPDPGDTIHAWVRRSLTLLKSKIDRDAMSPDDRALTSGSVVSNDRTEIEDEIIAAIDKAGETQYDKYLANDDSGRDNTVSILRGWSSAVTLLEGTEGRWRGGGYFLKWRGYGIVIDPGFDFLRNFHDAGYHGREISGVVVSHNHPDHNSDLKTIDDLRYELYIRLNASGKPGGAPYVLVWDEDTSKATKFTSDTPAHRNDPITMGSGFPRPHDLSGHQSKIPIRITHFKVNHGSDVPSALGMVIELIAEDGTTAFRLGYTADTGYFADLHRHLSDCDVLIAHISQPTKKELKDPKEPKKVHLGYWGTAKLISECKPKLALIGEFWAGFADLRILLTKGLRLRSGLDQVLPTGLGMHLRLPSMEIECSECSKPTPYSEIRIAPPTDQFGSLAYLCPKCML